MSSSEALTVNQKLDNLNKAAEIFRTFLLSVEETQLRSRLRQIEQEKAKKQAEASA